MAIDAEGSRVIAGECKYHEAPVGMEVYVDLQEKCAWIPELGNLEVSLHNLLQKWVYPAYAGDGQRQRKTAAG